MKRNTEEKRTREELSDNFAICICILILLGVGLVLLL